MKTRVTKQKLLYYVQFLEPKTNQKDFGSEFLVQKWKYYGGYDDEGVFNRIPFGCADDAVMKAKELSGYDCMEIVWQSV